jgi:hypothetical protein
LYYSIIYILAHLGANESGGDEWRGAERRDFSLIQNQHGADRDFVVGRMRGEKALEQKHLSTCSASRILFLPLIDPSEGIFDGNLWVLWI